MPYVTLNPETRKMILPDEYRHFGVESDEKSKRIEFQFPRFVDDIDLNDFNLYINYSNANNEKGMSIAEDVFVSDNEITFAWILSRHVTEYKGNVNFIVCAKKNISEYRVQNEWNTRIATADVEQGLEVHHLVESMSADAINKLMSDLLALGSQVEQNTQARHTHPNRTVLDLLSDVSGNLYYRGLKVSDDRVDEIIDLIPNEASEDNQLADKEFTENAIDEAIQPIRSMIPDGASAENQLADKAFVNDSISTNSAYFRGTFNSLAELQAYSGPVTNNDYAYVVIKDPSYPDIIKSYQRYKYSVNQWLYEYEIGLHDLTPEQLAALNSGITSDKIQTYDTVTTNTEKYGEIDGKPVFDGNKIKMESKDVQLVPFGEEITFVVNPEWAAVAEYLPTSNSRFAVKFETSSSTGDFVGIWMSRTRDAYGSYIKALNYADGSDRYTLFNGADSWLDSDGNPVDAPTIRGIVSSFDNDEVVAYSMSEIFSYTGMLESYKTFSRIFNVSLEAMGDDLYDKDGKETLPVSNGYAHPVPNRAYIVRPVDITDFSELQIYLPAGVTSYMDAQITFDILITNTESQAPISFLNISGPLYTYNGQVIDLTEPGHYRVIATWIPSVLGWSLASAKMEVPRHD